MSSFRLVQSRNYGDISNRHSSGGPVCIYLIAGFELLYVVHVSSGGGLDLMKKKLDNYLELPRIRSCVSPLLVSIVAALLVPPR